MQLRRKLLVLTLLSPMWMLNVMAQSTRDPDEHFFHPSFGDLAEELATARTQGKFGVLIMFETAECPWCIKMKQRVLNQVDVQIYFRQHFQIISVDTQGDISVVDFQGLEMPQKDFATIHNKIRATPVFAFFDLSGKLMVKYTGATRNVDEFKWLGEFVVDGHFATQNFTRYKRAKYSALDS